LFAGWTQETGSLILDFIEVDTPINSAFLRSTFGARAYYFVRKTGEVPDVNDPIFCTANSLGDKNWSSAAIRDLGSAIVED
jgi:hypothetical protein